MKRMLLIILGLCITALFLSCEINTAEDAGDLSISLPNFTNNYVWIQDNNMLLIQAEAENLTKLDYIKFQIDNFESYSIHLEPYNYEFDLNELGDSYNLHTIKVIAVYQDDSSTEKQKDFYFSPCPIEQSDLENINGITGRDAENNPDGNVDENDWSYSINIPTDVSFGPAYPNPCVTSTCTIKLTNQFQLTASIIVLNNKGEIFQIIKAQKTYYPDDAHYITWENIPQNEKDIYRIVYDFQYIDENNQAKTLHGHGDIEIQ